MPNYLDVGIYDIEVSTDGNTFIGSPTIYIEIKECPDGYICSALSAPVACPKGMYCP